MSNSRNTSSKFSQGAEDGKSSYQIWLELGNSGTEQDFVDSLKGKSAYDIAVDNGFSGNEATWLQSVNGIPQRFHTIKAGDQVLSGGGYNDVAGWVSPVAWALGVETGIDGLFTFNSGVLIVNQNAWMMIDIGLYLKQISGNSRTQGGFRLVKDDGSGFQAVPGTERGTYHRQISEGDEPAHIGIPQYVSAGTEFKLQARNTVSSRVQMVMESGTHFSAWGYQV